MARTEQFVNRAVRFGRRLRRAGVNVTSGQVMDFVQSVEHIDIGNRDIFREAGRACFVTTKEEVPVFDRVFESFWRGKAEYADDPMADPGDDTQPGMDGDSELDADGGEEGDESSDESGTQKTKSRTEMIESQEVDGDGEEEEGDADDVLSFSSSEVLREKDFADLTDSEMEQTRRFMEQLEWSIGKRRSRRKVSARKGRFWDARKTMRKSLQTGGVPINISRRKLKDKPRQLVVICDVSGSMDRYSRILLQFVYAIEKGMANVESFVFGTRLTRITRLLRNRSIDSAMERVAEQVHDWSGGTRIGQSLQVFNTNWARRVLRNGAVVLVISDGWDRGDPDLLGQEMARLQRSSYRMIWLNPLLGSPRYEPLTRGMQAAIPFIDDFMPVHNLASLEALAEHLGNIDEYRPVRRQNPLDLSPPKPRVA
ncbi:MAG: VWA domain-containing protein [Sphaerobacteraceae bacterium]|nr:MAG: VWA domain-containing protein [Sphaerobacteraceae bacterium]